MTYQEINKAVATKLGVKLSTDPWRETAPSEWWHKNGGSKWCGVEEHPPYTIPDYCHSIAAAWEIVDYWKYRPFRMANTVGGGYRVSFTDTLVHNHCNCEEACTYEVEGEVVSDTVPMAICLAFLKLPFSCQSKHCQGLH